MPIKSMFISAQIRRLNSAITIVVTSAVFITPNTLIASDEYQVPKTEFGHPDLRGVWNFSSDIPMERPAGTEKDALTQEELDAKRAATAKQLEAIDNYKGNGLGVGGYNTFWMEAGAQSDDFRTSLIVDPPNGRLPKRVDGAIVQRGGLGPDIPSTHPVRFRVGGIAKNGPEDRGLSERCLKGFNSGPPFVPSLYNNNAQIFQTKDHVVVMTEMIHDARIIPLSDTPRKGANMSRWSGESRGHWEDNTLVVETLNFTNKINTFASSGTGDNMRLIERFTRTADDKVMYQFTVEDPETFTKPFTALVTMQQIDGQIYEYACHEGNYAMINILSGERLQEKLASE